jgi:glutamyl-tRNA synthetase
MGRRAARPQILPVQPARVYHQAARKLLREGNAYPCYCSPEELEAKRKQAEREHRKPGYDGTCRDKPFSRELLLPDKSAGRNYAIRFRIGQSGQTVIEDLVKGRAVFENSELDDLVILRSDGGATYNFATVVDDAEFGITHVVRGDDLLPSTPRQIQMFGALGLKPPAYAHLPQVMGPDGSKLSKRHGATSVLAYREGGFLPEALLNYLARLGWSHGDQEIFSRQELIRFFDFAECGKSAGVFNADKLLWLNFNYLKQKTPAELAILARPFIERRGYQIPAEPGWLEKMVRTLQERAKTLVELVDFAQFYLSDEIRIDPKAEAKFLKPETGEALCALASELESLDGDFTEASIKGAFDRVLARHDLKLSQLAQPVRVALTGGTVSPGIYQVIEVLGSSRTVVRLREAMRRIEAGG